VPHHDLAISPPIAAARAAPAASAASGVELRVESDLAAVEREWKAFERDADCTVFQSFDWVAKWQRHIGAPRGTIPAVVFGRDGDGRLLFILQLAVETRGSTRRLTWLASDLCDYNAPLLAPHFHQRFDAGRFLRLWGEVIALVRADPRLAFDWIDFAKMPESVGAQRNPFLALSVLANPSGAYVATLGRDWEAFLAEKRSAATRKRERRQLKHLAEHGAVRYADVAEPGAVRATLATLFSQKTRSFARMGVEDVFARPGYRDFFLDMATDPVSSSLTHVSRLEVGETVAAANFGLAFRDCYYLMISSYQDGALARFGPGRAHLHELIRHAIERGFRRFDFTIGDEPYKREWADTELRLYDHLAGVTLAGALVVATTAAFRHAKRFIKQTPFVWQAFSKARALAGMINSR
jgi:CelD/BcsL family acetyltransferase involved in cellulose biosynthesis